MRTLFATLSIIIGFVGFIFIILGGIHPNRYQRTLEESNTAVQVTQVYMEATYTITVGIGIISIAALVAIIGILFYINRPLNAADTQSAENPEPDQPS